MHILLICEQNYLSIYLENVLLFNSTLFETSFSCRIYVIHLIYVCACPRVCRVRMLCMYIYMYMYLYTCMCICMYIYVHICVHTHTHTEFANLHFVLNIVVWKNSNCGKCLYHARCISISLLEKYHNTVIIIVVYIGRKSISA